MSADNPEAMACLCALYIKPELSLLKVRQGHEDMSLICCQDLTIFGIMVHLLSLSAK